MEEAYRIFSDGSCDLGRETAEKNGVTVVPFYVSFDGEHYYKEIEEMGVREFYQRMVDNPREFPKSSLPSTQDYLDAFLPSVREGVPVLCICITTKFSGSMQSALAAKNILLEDCPEARITVIDATVNTVLQGLFVEEAVRLRDSGAGYEQTIARLEEIKGTGRIFFTVGGLEHLQHGGRIGRVAGAAGSILGIRPIITLKQGEIFPSGIGRSRRKTAEKTIDLLLAYLKETGEDISGYSLAVGYGYDYEEACGYRDRVLEALGAGFEPERLPIRQIGATIGVHTGPHPLGVGIIHRSI